MSRTLFTPFAYTLLATSLALATVGCNKKNTASTTAATSSTSSTTITTTSSTTLTTAESATPTTTLDSAASATALSANSATAATSAPATTQVQGNPKDTVEKFVAALRTGNVKTAMTYLQTNDAKAMSQYLTQNIPQYKSIKSVKFAEPQFSPEKDRALVVAKFSTKTTPNPIETPYGLVQTPTGWKLLAEAPPKEKPVLDKNGKPQTTSNLLTASEAAALKASDGKSTTMKDKNGKVIATLRPQQKPRTEPIIVDTTKKGTPEDTVKQAMNTLVLGTTKDAAKFYKSKNPKLLDIVANQQVLFQQNLQSVKIVDTKYSKNKTQAQVNVLLTPFPPAPPVKATKHSKKKPQPQPAPQPQAGVIKLEKKGGVWKILAD